MANVYISSLTWINKTLSIGGVDWPFVQINIEYPDSTTLEPNNFFYFDQVFASYNDMLKAFEGAVSSCFYSGRGLDLGTEAYYGDGPIRLHRYVERNHAGVAINYNNIEWGFTSIYDISGNWENTICYQFIIYDAKTNKYYVPVASYLLMSRWEAPTDMVISNALINPVSIISEGSIDVQASLRAVQFRYNKDLSDFISTAKEISSDPYSQGGESDTGGGEGNFDGTSVNVDFTSLPTLSAVSTGFITLYNPTVAQLQSLSSYMWSDLFDLDTLKKLFADPMQAILGLSIVPGPIPSTGAQVVKVGNISTGVTMNKATTQYIDIDCGTLNVEEFWGAYLDYEPYTKAEIYLPYIGTHQIAVDDIMGKAVHIKYHIDILSGACAAEIKCGGSVLYTFIGSVAVSIPVTGNDWTNVINGVLSIAGAVGSMVATGGASAPAAAGEIASAAVNSLKPNIEKSGSVSGGGGLMAGKVPVLILTRPRQALPASQNSFTGYPAFITRSLGEVSGYTEVHKIRLGGISATDAELDEIKNLLKGGVIL